MELSTKHNAYLEDFRISHQFFNRIIRVKSVSTKYLQMNKTKVECTLFYFIDCFHDPIMQYVLGGSLHKNNTIYLPLGLYHASVN